MAKMTVNGIEYKSKGAAQEMAKKILNAAKMYQPLPEQRKLFMIDWFRQVHEDWQRKKGNGIKEITVRVTGKYKSKGFWIERVDGSMTDIGYLPPTKHKTRVTAALRDAIEPDIMAFRESSGATANDHIDHAPPNTFKVIVSSFFAGEGIKINTVKLKTHGDGDTTQELLDRGLHARFVAHHNNLAKLQVLAATENLKKSDGALCIKSYHMSEKGADFTEGKVYPLGERWEHGTKMKGDTGDMLWFPQETFEQYFK